MGRGLPRVSKRVGCADLLTPYITFPISDRRKSGFLPPTFGSSSDNGFDFTLPYYWNIAPEMDATFAPRILGDRGVLLGGQYRYLIRRGDGQLDAEYLPVDSERNDDTRWLIGYNHEQYFAGPRGHLFLEFNRVSMTSISTTSGPAWT